MLHTESEQDREVLLSFKACVYSSCTLTVAIVTQSISWYHTFKQIMIHTSQKISS